MNAMGGTVNYNPYVIFDNETHNEVILIKNYQKTIARDH